MDLFRMITGLCHLGFETVAYNMPLIDNYIVCFTTCRLLSPSDHVVASCLWLNAHLGTGIYIFSREHMRKTTTYYRVVYSVFGSAIFNFGSVLLWAIAKKLLPRNDIARIAFGLSSGLCFLSVGHEYLKFVDSQVDREI